MSLPGKGLSDGMEVEQEDLADCRGADKRGLFVHLWAGFEAAAAGHTARKRVAELPYVIVLRLRLAEVERTVDRHPTLDPFEVLEHLRPVDDEIAHEGKLLHGLERDLVKFAARLPDILDQGRAGLADVAVDVHRARSADFFEAGRLPDRRLDGLAAARDWVALHFHEGRDDIQLLPEGNLEDVLPLGLSLPSLTQNGQSNLGRHAR